MKISILSDIHDNVWKLGKALSTEALQNSDAMLCCGDLCAPFIIKLLGNAFSKPIHIVLGNNDGDVTSIIGVAANFDNIHIHGEYFRGEIGGKQIAMNHYPDKARKIAQNGGYNLVCYGHNHELKVDEYIGDTLLINPGPIMGYHGGKLIDLPSSFVVLDLETMKSSVHYP